MDQTAQEVLQVAEQAIQSKDYAKAIDLLDLLLAKAPQDVHLRYMISSIYSELGKMGIAISMLEQVVKDAPDHSQAWNNLGIAYKTAAQFDKAKEAYSKALELNYAPISLINFSGLYINNGTPEEALRLTEKGLKLDPNSPQLRNHKSLALLEMKRWKEGFSYYDSRFGLPAWSTRHYEGPYWKGERVKKLLIHGEQGLGDEVMFMSAMDRVKQRVDEVILEATPKMLETFKYSFDCKAWATEKEVKASGETWDAWVAMGSLFNILGVERKGAFLKTPKVYPKGDKFRIGVSWRGGTVQTHEHLRNFRMDWWKPLMALNGEVEIVSLQYGPAEGMAEKFGIKHDGESIADIPTLMAMIQSCDLVISVCNTTVHLSGSLGVPCWVLVPDAPAWRYCSDDDKMLFYESVKLFRQNGLTWDNVILKVVDNLANLGIVQGAEQAVA